MKNIELQYGRDGCFEITVPDSADVRTMKKVAPLANPTDHLRRTLNQPIAGPPLRQLAAGKKTAVIVVSDNTRPVPYKEPDGILAPILETLKQTELEKITIIVATGTHHPMDEDQLRQMLGDSAFADGIEIINHVCTDSEMLRSIGSTDRTPEVTVNRHYLDADLKILTGLVEPHFMAGVSGGPKAVCPGICGQGVTYGFHSASIINEKNTDTMTVEQNPCHQESMRIAKMAGVDFIVNVTINTDKKITGIFSGELEEAHHAAIEHLSSFTKIELDHLYDVIITQAGPVGINHYQATKAAVEAARIVTPTGSIVITGHFDDIDPIGDRNYKDMLKLMTRIGHKAFLEEILSNHWNFIPQQWGVQMWAKAFRKLGTPKNLYTCAPQLQNFPDGAIPEVNIAAQFERLPNETDVNFARRITQDTIDHVIEANPSRKILVLPDGPYAVPVLKPAQPSNERNSS